MFTRGSVWPVLLVCIHKMAGVNKVIVTTSTLRCSSFLLSAAHAFNSQGLERAVAVGVEKGSQIQERKRIGLSGFFSALML